MFTRYAHAIIGLLLLWCGLLTACTHSQHAPNTTPPPLFTPAPPSPPHYDLLSLEQISRPWGKLSQIERDQRLIAEARRQLGRTGWNCKMWLCSMVFTASHGAVTVPRTLPNAAGYYWELDPRVQSLCGDISIARPGWAVQSQWRLRSGAITPHTFFIEEMRGGECVIIESNWDRAYTVTRRVLSLARFRESAVAYTLHSFK